MKLECDKVIKGEADCIPTYKIIDVKDQFDFKKSEKISDKNRLETMDPYLNGDGKKGIDHAFVINGSEAADNKLR